MFGKRSDGVVAKNIDPMLRITSAMMPRRYDAMVNYLLEVRCDDIDNFIASEREKGNDFSYMDVLFAAIVRMYASRPDMNRFTMNTRIYKRNNISICFAVKKQLRDGADETVVKLEFDGTENIYQVRQKVHEAISVNKGAEKENKTDKFAKFLLKCPPFLLKMAVGFLRFLDRHGMLSKKIIKLSPFHASCFVTNMKSISCEYVYHHIYDIGTVGMFAGMGKVIKRVVPKDEGGFETARVFQIGVVIDERICDGLYHSKSIKEIKRFLTDIETLKDNYVLKEVISDKQKAKLQKKLLKKTKKQEKTIKKQEKKIKKLEKKLNKQNKKEN